MPSAARTTSRAASLRASSPSAARSLTRHSGAAARRGLSRAALALGWAGILALTDPLATVEREGALHRVRASRDASSRDTAVVTLVQHGRREFARAQLAQAGLAGLDLAGGDFTGADLRGANLGGANLNGAHLAGANLAEARLAGADLSATQLDQALGVDASACDERTRFPAGWRCRAGLTTSER